MMEPLILNKAEHRGWIELICGSMFSGKTEELIRRLRRAQIARQRVEIFKPAIETRYSRHNVVSHDETSIHSTAVETAQDILVLAGDADVIGVDEAQFFDQELVHAADRLARAGKRVIIAGLDQDYLGRPFEPVPSLMSIAEHVTKLHAVCVVCGAPANHSQRISTSRELVMLGATEAYEPRCRQCFEPHAIPKSAQTEMYLPEERLRASDRHGAATLRRNLEEGAEDKGGADVVGDVDDVEGVKVTKGAGHAEDADGAGGPNDAKNTTDSDSPAERESVRAEQ